MCPRILLCGESNGNDDIGHTRGSACSDKKAQSDQVERDSSPCNVGLCPKVGNNGPINDRQRIDRRRCHGVGQGNQKRFGKTLPGELKRENRSGFQPNYRRSDT